MKKGNFFLNAEILNVLFILLIAAFVSCGNIFEPPSHNGEGDKTGPEQNLPEESQGNGTLTVCLFIPDYEKLSQNIRAIAPQTAKVRLLTRGAGTVFTPFKTLIIDPKEIAPVEGAPEDIPGVIWNGNFSSVKSGRYEAGDLKIELLDNNDEVLSAGLNNEIVLIAPDETAQAVFFTIPVTLTNTGSLTKGEMKFWKITMSAGISYKLTLTAAGSWPDIVLFNSNGTYNRYYRINSPADAEISITPSADVSYYTGVYARAGNVSSYSLELSDNQSDIDDSIFLDDFSSGTLDGWTASRSGINAPYPVIRNEGGERGYVVNFDAGTTMPNGGRSAISKIVSLPAPMELRFLYKTDIGVTISVELVLYIDNKRIASYNGLGGSWAADSFIIDSGEHEIKFSLEKNSASYYYSYTNTVCLDNICIRPEPPSQASITENFEYADNNAWYASPWYGTAMLTTQAAEAPSNPNFGNATKFVKLRALTSSGGGKITLERRVYPSQDSALTFRFRTEITAAFGQNFTLYVDNAEKGSWSGTNTAWRNETVLIPPGRHTIRFEVTSTGTYSLSGLNAVYVDDVSLVPDLTGSVELYPRGQLNTYVGIPENQKIQFRAQALRSDGSVRKGAAGFVFSGPGINSGTGVLTPQAAGNITISVSLDGKSTSSQITVHAADYMRQPYYYPGTKKTYNGYMGTPGTLNTNGGVTINYPSATTFSADAFFTLEGTINNSNSAVYNYAYVEVVKNSDPSNLKTYYLVRNSFKERIWLRFGSGAYTVRVYGLSSINLSSALGAEGDYGGCYTTGSPIVFNITNTRNDDTSADYSIPDKRFIYPSYLSQSDDFRISNLAADLTYGINDDYEKIKVIHDYIITNTVYDTDSLVSGQRKKQDALTVLGTRYRIDAQYEPAGHYVAVCEGYSNLTTALVRVLGLETKFIGSNSLNHGWNNIHVNGGWKLYDATWDDPLRSSGVTADFGPAFVRYENFLLDDLTGGSRPHTGGVADNGRSAVSTYVPWQRGVPDGWY